MNAKYEFLHAEVFGIQKFIFSTGKLKEMIGGSEMIESFSAELFDEVCENIGLEQFEAVAHTIDKNQDWVVPMQQSAGTLKAVVSTSEAAKKFLNELSRIVWQRMPGLPFTGTFVPLEWSKDGRGKALREAKDRIAVKRSGIVPYEGLPMMPVLQKARLDGLSAVGKEKDEYVSQVSMSKRSALFKQKSQDRLKGRYDAAIEAVTRGSAQFVWTDNIEDLADKEGEKVALIHIDGNDLGKMFKARLSELEDNSDLDFVNKQLSELSQLVVDSNIKAFEKAIIACLAKIAPEAGRENIIPLRPLVMGGDDVTVIVRSDLAFAFIDAYVKEFETYTADMGKALSVGVGMVVMPKSYPFAKAFKLAEDLLSSSKRATLDYEDDRPSSMDYVVVTGDVESDLSALRKRLFTSKDKKHYLTSKPFILSEGFIEQFVSTGYEVLEKLPRSGVRAAVNACRSSKEDADKEFRRIKENLLRGLGGRKGKSMMSQERFDEIFDESSFFIPAESASESEKYVTRLMDYLELKHLGVE